MKVDQEHWNKKISNLLKKRGEREYRTNLSDYGSHIRKGMIGKTVLDIGCGSMEIKKYLQSDINYTGLDANPISEEVVKMKIEDCNLDDQSFETCYCFAALDGFEDFDKAINQIKRITKNNVMFLTGIDIEPDEYHTLKIDEDVLIKSMRPEFEVTVFEYLQPKVLLIEFTRK